jgi:molybdopterin/thiamine biosynthesis adenylyltransferase
MDFNEEEIERYSRHIILKEVGGEGQKKLKDAKVFMVGAGGLGSPSALYLAAAGVGTLGIVDLDVVDLSNLQRQVLHTTPDVGRPKVDSARETLQAINPHVKVNTYSERITSANVLDIIKDYDVVMDGSDNFPTRFLMNDACFMLKKPLVSGSMFRFDGQITVLKGHDKDAPCYRCLYPEPPPADLVPSCQEAGILGVLAGTVGVLQAAETIKLILGQGEPLVGQLLVYNALEMEFMRVKYRKNPNCLLCGPNPQITELLDYEISCTLQQH